MSKTEVLVPSDGNKFFMCTVQVDGENPDNGKPKKYKEVHLVNAVNPTSVEKKITEQMEGTIYSWRITNIAESKIQFVY